MYLQVYFYIYLQVSFMQVPQTILFLFPLILNHVWLGIKKCN
jgi:hypothetical protein